MLGIQALSLVIDVVSKNTVRLLVALSVFCVPAAWSSGPVVIPRVVPYASGIGTPAVRSECNWNTQISGLIADHARSGVRIEYGEIAGASGRVLSMTITNVHTLGGGRFTGPKWATIHGELREGAEGVVTFDANRTTRRGGITGCGALERVGKALAKDIARWLAAPTMGAKLGNARQRIYRLDRRPRAMRREAVP